MCNSLAQALFSRTGEERCISDVSCSDEGEEGEGKVVVVVMACALKKRVRGTLAAAHTRHSCIKCTACPTASVGLEADAGSPITTDLVCQAPLWSQLARVLRCVVWTPVTSPV